MHIYSIYTKEDKKERGHATKSHTENLSAKKPSMMCLCLPTIYCYIAHALFIRNFLFFIQWACVATY